MSLYYIYNYDIYSMSLITRVSDACCNHNSPNTFNGIILPQLFKKINNTSKIITITIIWIKCKTKILDFNIHSRTSVMILIK